MEKLKNSHKSRTMWLAMALAVAGVVQTQADVFGQLLGPAAQGWATFLAGLAVAVLRVLTVEGLDEK